MQKQMGKDKVRQIKRIFHRNSIEPPQGNISPGKFTTEIFLHTEKILVGKLIPSTKSSSI